MFADNTFDFVWSEDAWCHVPDKADLIATAVRLVKPGSGIIAFTDWVEGNTKMTEDEYQQYLNILTYVCYVCASVVLCCGVAWWYCRTTCISQHSNVICLSFHIEISSRRKSNTRDICCKEEGEEGEE